MLCVSPSSGRLVIIVKSFCFLLFKLGCLTTNFGSLSRRQSQQPDVKNRVLQSILNPKVTGGLVKGQLRKLDQTPNRAELATFLLLKFDQLFGYNLAANFGELLREQPHSSDISRCVLLILSRRSPEASQRAWVPKPGQAASGVYNASKALIHQATHPIDHSPHESNALTL